MWRIAKSKIVILELFMLFTLQIPLFLDDCKNLKEENNFELILKIVETKVRIDRTMTAELKFVSRKGTFRIYKHPTLGVAAAISVLLNFKMLFPDGTLLTEWYDEYNVHSGGGKLPWAGEFVDITPGSPYTERIVIHPGKKLFGYWPDDGIVKIKASYSYKHEKTWKYGGDLWEGEVESNWAEVEITYY